MSKDVIYTPKETFSGTDEDGTPMVFRHDVHRFREGHPLFERYRHLLVPLKVHYDVEDATAVPGRKRGE